MVDGTKAFAINLALVKLTSESSLFLLRLLVAYETKDLRLVVVIVSIQHFKHLSGRIGTFEGGTECPAQNSNQTLWTLP